MIRNRRKQPFWTAGKIQSCFVGLVMILFIFHNTNFATPLKNNDDKDTIRYSTTTLGESTSLSSSSSLNSESPPTPLTGALAKIQEKMDKKAGGRGEPSLEPDSTPEYTSLAIHNNFLKKECASVDLLVEQGTITASEALSRYDSLLYELPENAEVETPPTVAEPNDCKHIFLDFGANRGDSITHLADASRASCNDRSPPHKYDVVEMKLVEREKKRNGQFRDGLENQLRGIMESEGGLSSNQFCAYGYEGNPHFNTQLRDVETFLNSEEPRMLKWAQFFTETVGAGVDGDLSLFLDTINEEQHFWGSSIVSSHKDSQASGGVSVPVTAVTMSTIFKTKMRSTERGGVVIIKMDIEGGEYPMLDEAAKGGAVCDYIARGNKVYWMIEFHFNSLRGAVGYEKEKGSHQANKKLLEKCGVVFSDAPAIWG